MNFERPIHFDKDASAVWIKYYTGQSRSGSGIPGYYGDIYQRGSGIWGTLFRKLALPVIKYFGKKGASTLVKAGSAALSGENFVESLKKHGKEAATDIVSDAAKRATTFIQTGKGKKRSRKPKKNKRNKKRKTTKLFY
jgi:hypothetical protein